jgi:hypothetical protein
MAFTVNFGEHCRTAWRLAQDVVPLHSSNTTHDVPEKVAEIIFHDLRHLAGSRYPVVTFNIPLAAGVQSPHEQPMLLQAATPGCQ